jgi:hypothetical protein
VFVYAGLDGTSPLNFWYYREPSCDHRTLGTDHPCGGLPAGSPYPGFFAVAWPDLMLGGSLDAQTAGNPGIAFQDISCPAIGGCPGNWYAHTYGVTFYPDVVPYADPSYLTYNGGLYFEGYVDGTNGGSGLMSSPKIARNPYGYVDPVPGSSPLTWRTYLYYRDCPSPPSKWVDHLGCGLGVSLLTVTQQ